MYIYLLAPALLDTYQDVNQPQNQPVDEIEQADCRAAYTSGQNMTLLIFIRPTLMPASLRP